MWCQEHLGLRNAEFIWRLLVILHFITFLICWLKYNFFASIHRDMCGGIAVHVYIRLCLTKLSFVYAHSFCCALFHCSCIISFDGSMWWIHPYPLLSADSRFWLANNRKEWICTSRLTSSTWCISRVTSLTTSQWRVRLLWRSDMIIIFRCWQDLFLFSIKEHMKNKGSYSHLGPQYHAWPSIARGTAMLRVDNSHICVSKQGVTNNIIWVASLVLRKWLTRKNGQ